MSIGNVAKYVRKKYGVSIKDYSKGPTKLIFESGDFTYTINDTTDLFNTVDKLFDHRISVIKPLSNSLDIKPRYIKEVVRSTPIEQKIVGSIKARKDIIFFTDKGIKFVYSGASGDITLFYRDIELRTNDKFLSFNCIEALSLLDFKKVMP